MYVLCVVCEDLLGGVFFYCFFMPIFTPCPPLPSASFANLPAKMQGIRINGQRLWQARYPNANLELDLFPKGEHMFTLLAYYHT